MTGFGQESVADASGPPADRSADASANTDVRDPSTADGSTIAGDVADAVETDAMALDPLHAFYVSSSQGDDDNSGRTPGAPWKTLARVNAHVFVPGDVIHLRAGDQWRETLVVGSSGAAAAPIIYTRYGTGANPLIKLTEAVPRADWTLWYDADGKKIYRASSPMPYRRVLVRDHNRVHRALGTLSESGIQSRLADGWYHTRAGDSYVYYRNDAGDPGDWEVGARMNGIRINGRSHVTIHAIDVFGGPGYAQPLASGFDAVAIKNTHSQHIRFSSLEISFTDFAVHNNQFTGVVFDKVDINNCRFGIYSSGSMTDGVQGSQTASGLTFQNGSIAHIGEYSPDIGDLECMGIHTVKDVTIRDSYFADNGRDYEGSNVSHLVTIFRVDNALVERSYFHNGGAALLGIVGNTVGTRNSVVRYNVFDGWAQHDSSKTFGRAGLHYTTAYATPNYGYAYVYNNLFINGPDARTGSYSAGIVKTSSSIYVTDEVFDRLYIKNNIFFGNNNVCELVFARPANIADLQISNNIIFRTSGRIVKYTSPSSSYEADEIDRWISEQDHVERIWNLDPLLNSTKSGPGYDKDLRGRSPAINRGVDLGLQADYRHNPIVGLPDLGPFERTNASGLASR